LFLLFFDCCESFHQPALSAGSIILVNNTLLGSFIQGTDRQESGLLRNFLVTFFDGCDRFTYKGSGTPAVDPVVDAAFFILPVSLDL
jgi:hypothetical protein